MVFCTKSASLIARMGTLDGTKNGAVAQGDYRGRVMMALFWGMGPCGRTVMCVECRNTLENVTYTLFCTGCPGFECLSKVIHTLSADTVRDFLITRSGLRYGLNAYPGFFTLDQSNA